MNQDQIKEALRLADEMEADLPAVCGFGAANVTMSAIAFLRTLAAGVQLAVDMSRLQDVLHEGIVRWHEVQGIPGEPEQAASLAASLFFSVLEDASVPVHIAGAQQVSPVAYMCSDPSRANHLMSAAQWKNALPKNRAPFDVPLYTRPPAAQVPAGWLRLDESGPGSLDPMFIKGAPAPQGLHGGTYEPLFRAASLEPKA